MSVLVGSARIDENGKISGGQAGDQTGNEVCTQEWYSKPWDFMAIHPDANVREKHAQAVEQACANDNVGYDQGQRNTLNTQAAKVDYVIKNIQTKCECDCSSLQDVAAIASGAEKASNYGSNGWTTSSMRSALKALGYVIITASDYLKSSAYCVRGAIYVSEGHHTVAGLSNGSSYQKTLEKAGVSGSTSSRTTSSGTTSSGSTKVEAAQSGPDNSISGTYTVTASPSLNIRYGPSKNYDVRTSVAKGGTVQNYGYYSTTNGVRWLYVIANGLKGYASSEYLQKSSSSSGSTSTTSSLPTYKVGNTYKIQASRLAVRTSPEVKNNPSNRKAKSQLTDDGKKHADSEGYLLKGTSVTCKATRTNGGDVWMQIPSGWVAAYYDGQKYIS